MVEFLLNASATLIQGVASQVLKTCLERPGTMSKSREGALRSLTGVKSKMTVTYLSPYGVWRHSQGT